MLDTYSLNKERKERYSTFFFWIEVASCLPNFPSSFGYLIIITQPEHNDIKFDRNVYLISRCVLFCCFLAC